MHQGFIEQCKEEMGYRFKKALYGLKQAPRAWYDRIDQHFIKHEFLKSEREPTLYIKKDVKKGFMMVVLYVGDMIYVGTEQGILDEFKD